MFKNGHRKQLLDFGEMGNCSLIVSCQNQLSKNVLRHMLCVS